jgi:hypothetical protein
MGIGTSRRRRGRVSAPYAWPMTAAGAEGWYVDPFGSHAHRWFSDGRPTLLVRDATGEAHDPPPAPTYDGPLTEVETPEPANGTDLRRSGDPDAPTVYDPRAAVDAATDAFATGSVGFNHPDRPTAGESIERQPSD